MSKKAVSPMWLPVDPEVWHQSPRQAALVVSQLPTDLGVEECAQQASATARVVRTLDYGGRHRPPTGRPKWLQPADASSNHCALVAPAASPGGRVLGCPPSDPRWHLSGSPERRLCGDGCDPLRRGVCGPRNGGRPCAPAAVLHHPGPSRVHAVQCDRRWQPARDPDLAPSVADDRHSTLSGPHPTSRPQLVSPVVQTPVNYAPCFATSWGSTPWPSGIGSSLRCRRGRRDTGRSRHARSLPTPGTYSGGWTMA